MPNLSIVLPYYSYTHICYKTLTQLNSHSRKQFFKNKNAFLSVILKSNRLQLRTLYFSYKLTLKKYELLASLFKFNVEISSPRDVEIIMKTWKEHPYCIPSTIRLIYSSSMYDYYEKFTRKSSVQNVKMVALRMLLSTFFMKNGEPEQCGEFNIKEIEIIHDGLKSEYAEIKKESWEENERHFLDNLNKVVVSLKYDENFCDFLKFQGEKFHKLFNSTNSKGCLCIPKYVPELKEYNIMDDKDNTIKIDEILSTAAQKTTKKVTYNRNHKFKNILSISIPNGTLYTYSTKTHSFKAYSTGPCTIIIPKRSDELFAIDDNLITCPNIIWITISNPFLTSATIPTILTKIPPPSEPDFLAIHTTQKFSFSIEYKNNFSISLHPTHLPARSLTKSYSSILTITHSPTQNPTKIYDFMKKSSLTLRYTKKLQEMLSPKTKKISIFHSVFQDTFWDILKDKKYGEGLEEIEIVMDDYGVCSLGRYGLVRKRDVISMTKKLFQVVDERERVKRVGIYTKNIIDLKQACRELKRLYFVKITEVYRFQKNYYYVEVIFC
jgi:hypothetical protein